MQLLRSMLYVPSYSKKFLGKVKDVKADAVIFDLEDSVPTQFKKEARENLCEFLKSYEPDGKKLFVRLNSIESGILFDDLAYVMSEKLHGFMLTKIYSHEDMIYYDKLITQYENDSGMGEHHFAFVPLIETASAVLDAFRIAGSTVRVKALAFGSEDYLNDMGGFHGTPPKGLDYPRAQIAVAARSAGALPIDTPYLRIHDDDGFREEARLSFELGFAGIQCLTPHQAEMADECFLPTQKEVRDSQEIVRSIEESSEKGSGVAMYNGNMIGPPMERRARKVLALLEAAQKGMNDSI
ncbi:MAG: CoA ester lyase [Synergistaceae bacterium]|nr:CoA ester lyase [Synergistaceae bacterium]